MNKHSSTAFVWIFIFFIFQNGLSFIFPALWPPFMLAAVVFYGLSRGPRFGFAAGVWAGLLIESLAAGRFGIQVTLWGAAGLISGLLSTKIFPDSWPAQALLPASIRGLMSAANFFWSSPSSSPVIFLGEIFSNKAAFFARFFETVLTAIFVFWLLRSRAKRKNK